VDPILGYFVLSLHVVAITSNKKAERFLSFEFTDSNEEVFLPLGKFPKVSNNATLFIVSALLFIKPIT
jgi:hypothetical protein